ncbi:MAG: helicase HerA domain-containing protein, partial [Desulfocucumaceae bacterium]
MIKVKLPFGLGRNRVKKPVNYNRDGENIFSGQDALNVLADWAADRAGGVKKGKDFLEIGTDVYSKTLLIREWPIQIKPEWIKPTLKGILKNTVLPEGVSLRIILHYQPANIKWDGGTKRRIRRLEKSVESAREIPGEKPDPGEVKALESIEDMREKTGEGFSLADVWCLISLFAESEDDLFYTVKNIVEALSNSNMSAVRLPYEQTRGFLQGWIAGGIDKEFYIKYPGRLVDEESASYLMPFTHGSLSDGRGIYMGHRVDEEDRSICFIDLEGGDSEGNKNFIILGASGEGKSTFLKALVDSLLLEGYLVFVFDVDGEYWPICQEVGGLWIDHTMASGKYIDPFKIAPALNENHPDHEVARMIKNENNLRLDRVLDGVMRLASLLAGGLTPAEANAADRALSEVWEEIEVNRENSSSWDNCRKASIHKWYKTVKGL